jgi:hypothetical protein
MSASDYVVFGGKLKMPGLLEFEDPENLHVVGRFVVYEDAYKAWQSEAHRTVDDAHACYVVKKSTDDLVVDLAGKCPALEKLTS